MHYTKLLMALPLAALFAALMAHAPARAQEGMVVARDPLTGELRAPTPAERKALNASPKASLRAAAPVAPQAIVNPDGSRKVRLGERGQVYEVVRRAPDGKLTGQCVQGEDAAGRALAKPVEARDEDR
ncbi:hypothetical protein GCM10027321_43150 [Massilia terrae]|uniref:Secreted protein n=1 Tax=Massilia terrae TaxID=1811224 RepID=A0ABT2D1N3_9BURK|nr:hypothetical protein [Massilia terrae]MCS0660164.1 hypothetical protein [Massilia terrae]